jgi:hypothetical protein
LQKRADVLPLIPCEPFLEVGEEHVGNHFAHPDPTNQVSLFFIRHGVVPFLVVTSPGAVVPMACSPKISWSGAWRLGYRFHNGYGMTVGPFKVFVRQGVAVDGNIVGVS